jgi:dihydroorotase-like cyclic amidohydrolase
MNLLIKSATIVDPNSPFHQQVADILIENGTITKIAVQIKAEVEVFDAKGKHVIPGFFDLNCNIRDPAIRYQGCCCRRFYGDRFNAKYPATRTFQGRS